MAIFRWDPLTAVASRLAGVFAPAWTMATRRSPVYLATSSTDYSLWWTPLHDLFALRGNTSASPRYTPWPSLAAGARADLYVIIRRVLTVRPSDRSYLVQSARSTLSRLPSGAGWAGTGCWYRRICNPYGLPAADQIRSELTTGAGCSLYACISRTYYIKVMQRAS